MTTGRRPGTSWSRRRIAPGLISCRDCDRDLDEKEDFRQIRDKRRDPDKYYPVARCKPCEKIWMARNKLAWERNNPYRLEERRRSHARACRTWRENVQGQRRREEREWATGLLRADVVALRERGWTRRAIAEATGVSWESVNAWEQGSRPVHSKTAVRVHPVLMALRNAPVGGGS